MAKRAARTCRSFWKQAAVALAVLFVIALAVAGSAAPPAAAAGPADGTSLAEGLPVGAEVDSLRTADSRTFVGADGTLVEHVYQEPVDYKDSSGAWQPIDNTLVGGVLGYENTANRLQVELPSDLSAAPVRVSDGSQWVTFSLDGASGLASVPSGSSLTYAGALPGVNVTYTATGETLKEDAVLLGPSSQQSFSYSVSTSSGLTAVQEPDGSVDFVDGDGKAMFSFSAPRLGDAAGADGLGSYQLSATPTGYEVALDANSAWLSSPDRVWPVTVDPSLTDDSAFYQPKTPAPTQDGYVYSGNPSSNWFGVGYEKVGWNSSGVRRILQQYAPVLPRGAQVLNATLNEFEQAYSTTSPGATVGVYSLTRSWTTNATWNRYDGTNAWSTAGGDFTSEPHQGAGAWAKTGVWASGLNQGFSWDITQLVAGWENTDVPKLGLMLKYVDETTNSNIFTFNSGTANGPHPYIAITYNYGIGDPGAGSVNLPVSVQTSDGNTDATNDAYSFGSIPVDDQTNIKVNYGNGNLLLCENDLTLPGVSGFDLNLTQCWNSMGGDPNGSMSGNWLLSPGQTTYLDASRSSVVYHDDTGDTQPFTSKGSGNYIAPIGFDAVLTATSGTLSACSSAAYSYRLSFNADGSREYFNSAGQLTAKADRNGDAICFTYQTNGNVHTITDTGGRTITFWYTNGQLTSLTAPGICAAPNCRFAYDSNQRLKSFTDAAGDTTQYAYNNYNGNLTSVTDPNGNATNLEYTTVAPQGPAVSWISNPAWPGHPTTFTYGDTSQPSFCGSANDVTSPDGSTTLYCADTGLRIRAIQAPDGSISRTDYIDTTHGGTGCVDQYGDSLDSQPCATQSGNGYWTTYGYDSTGQKLLWEQNPVQDASHRSTWAYGDSVHPYYPTSSADADGNTTTYTYTSAGNVSTQTDGAGSTTSYTYDSNGEVATEQTGLLRNSQTGALSCPSGTPAPICPTTAYSYDSQGNQTQMTVGLNDLNMVSTYGYDPAGNQTSETDGQTLDSSQNPVCATGNCPVTNRGYDGMGRLLTETNPDDGTATQYTVDGDGNQTSQTEGLSYNSSTQNYYCQSGSTCPTTSDVYTADNMLVSETPPNATTTSYSYDANGNQITQATDTSGGNQTTTYGYNSRDLQTSVQPPASSCATGATCPTQYTYDADGNVLTELTPDGYEIAYTYDHADELIQKVSGLTYDSSQHKYVCATGASCPTTTYGYDPAGNQTSVTQGDLANTSVSQTVTCYDSDNRVSTVTGGLDGSAQCPAGNALPKTIYTYDNNGNQATVTGTDLTQTQYLYNADNQVVITTSGLTASGTPPTYSCATGDTCPTTTTSYDNAGNLIISGSEVDDASGVASSDQSAALPAATIPRPVAPAEVDAGGGYASYPTEYWASDETNAPNGVQVITTTGANTWGLSGVVTDDATGNVIAGATVTLTSSDTPPTTLTATTDSNGAFAFADVPTNSTWTTTVAASSYGTYMGTNFTPTPDETYEQTISLTTAPQTLTESPPAAAQPAQDASVPSQKPFWASNSRIPPTIRVANFPKRSDNCTPVNHNDPSNTQINMRVYPWNYYILHVASWEIYSYWPKVTVQANMEAESSFAWYWKLGGGPPNARGDVTSDTNSQCFNTNTKVPRSTWKAWHDEVKQPLRYRVSTPNGKVYPAYFLSCGDTSTDCQNDYISNPCGSGDPGLPEHNGVLSQWESYYLVKNCHYSDWHAVDNYFYGGCPSARDSGKYPCNATVHDGLAPPLPTTKVSIGTHTVTLTFHTIGHLVGTTGQHVTTLDEAWKYQLDYRKQGGGWQALPGYTWKGSPANGLTIQTRYVYTGKQCLSYRVRAWNPVGWTRYASFTKKDAKICPKQHS